MQGFQTRQAVYITDSCLHPCLLCHNHSSDDFHVFHATCTTRKRMRHACLCNKPHL